MTAPTDTPEALAELCKREARHLFDLAPDAEDMAHLSMAIDRLASLAASAASLVAEHDVPIHWPTAWRDVLLERHRQTTKEGWAARHDDEHSSGAMALAAACYACNSATWSQRNASIPAADYLKFSTPGFRWPWATKWWKPKSQRQDLVRAGALILAEIERLDRQEKKQ